MPDRGDPSPRMGEPPHEAASRRARAAAARAVLRASYAPRHDAAQSHLADTRSHPIAAAAAPATAHAGTDAAPLLRDAGVQWDSEWGGGPCTLAATARLQRDLGESAAHLGRLQAR